jgi:hypothetical protein
LEVTKVLKPGFSTANGELIMWNAPNLEMSRRDIDGSYSLVYILNKKDAQLRMRKGGETLVDDAEEKQVPGSSVCHYAIVEDGKPNRNRPGCPLSEITGPLAIGETDRQDRDMLAEGTIAIEAWRDCSEPSCANPKRLVEKPDGSFRLVRGCDHLPVAPFARHRADLYGARRAAMPLIIAALKVMYGPSLDLDLLPKLYPCDFHNLMAQYDTVFTKKWVVLEGFTPNNGNYGLGLLSKAVNKSFCDELLAILVATMSQDLLVLFPADFFVRDCWMKRHIRMAKAWSLQRRRRP